MDATEISKRIAGDSTFNSLLQTRANLSAHIAARKKTLNPTAPDFSLVTTQQEGRLAAIEQSLTSRNAALFTAIVALESALSKSSPAPAAPVAAPVSVHSEEAPAPAEPAPAHDAASAK